MIKEVIKECENIKAEVIKQINYSIDYHREELEKLEQKLLTLESVDFKVNENYNNNFKFNFRDLLKPSITNSELLSFCQKNINEDISPKRATILFMNYLKKNKIEFIKTNSNGVRGFSIIKNSTLHGKNTK